MGNKNQVEKNWRKSLIANLGRIMQGCAQTIGKPRVVGTFGMFPTILPLLENYTHDLPCFHKTRITEYKQILKLGV